VAECLFARMDGLVQEVRRCKHGLDGTVRYLQHQLARERQISMHQFNAILALQMKRRDNCLHMLYLIYYVSCHTDEFLRNRAIWGSFWGTPSSRATVSNVLYLLPTSLWVWKITLTGSRLFSHSLNGEYDDDAIATIVGCACVFFNWAVLVGCVGLDKNPSNLWGTHSIHIPFLPHNTIQPCAIFQGCAAFSSLSLHIFCTELENTGDGYRGQFFILLIILTTFFPPVIEGLLDMASGEQHTFRTNPPWNAPRYNETPCGRAHGVVSFGIKYATLSLLTSGLESFDGRFLDAALIVRIMMGVVELPKALIHEESEYYLPSLENNYTSLLGVYFAVSSFRIAVAAYSMAPMGDGINYRIIVDEMSGLVIPNLFSVCLLLAANALMRGLDSLGRRFAKSIMRSFGENPNRNPTTAALGESSGVMCFGLWMLIVLFPVLGGGGGGGGSGGNPGLSQLGEI